MSGQQRSLRQIKKSWRYGLNLPLHREIDAEDMESAVYKANRGNKFKLMKLLWDGKADISDWAEYYEDHKVPFALEVRSGNFLTNVRIKDSFLDRVFERNQVEVIFTFNVVGRHEMGWEDLDGRLDAFYTLFGDTYYLDHHYDGGIFVDARPIEKRFGR